MRMKKLIYDEPHNCDSCPFVYLDDEEADRCGLNEEKLEDLSEAPKTCFLRTGHAEIRTNDSRLYIYLVANP